MELEFDKALIARVKKEFPTQKMDELRAARRVIRKTAEVWTDD